MVKTVVSVVIPTKGRAGQIFRCLDSILRQTLLPREIIIVDSSENANLGFFLKRKFPVDHPKIKYIHTGASLTKARNIGTQHSSGDVIFFFDDDVILDKDYIKEVTKVFMNDKDGKIGGVMGNITNLKRDTKSWSAMLRRLFYQDQFGNGKFRPSGLPTWVHGEKKILKTEFLSGCASAYRRQVLNEFKFDEKLGMLGGYCYLEDVDFSYRVSQKYDLLYTPFAKLEHQASWLKKNDANQIIKKQQLVRNHFYLFKKNTPKHLSNVFAFCSALFGYLLLTLLSERSPKGVIGWLRGIAHIAFSDTKHYNTI